MYCLLLFTNWCRSGRVEGGKQNEVLSLLTKPEYIGCAHLKAIVQDPSKYKVSPLDCGLLSEQVRALTFFTQIPEYVTVYFLEAFYNFMWNHENSTKLVISIAPRAAYNDVSERISRQPRIWLFIVTELEHGYVCYWNKCATGPPSDRCSPSRRIAHRGSVCEDNNKPRRTGYHWRGKPPLFMLQRLKLALLYEDVNNCYQVV